MIRRGRFQFCGQLCTTRVGELIGMHAQFHPELFRRDQNLSRLLEVEITALAKDVAKLREILLRDARQHFVDHKIDISLRRLSIFARNRVRAEKRRHNFEQRFLIEPLRHAQNL